MRHARATLLAGVVAAAGCFAVTPRAEGQDILGAWRGTTSVAGQVLPMVVRFSATDGALGATIDIQGATGIRLGEVAFDDPAVRFTLQAGPGLAVWEGELSGDSVTGTFTQAGITGSFAMARAEDEAPDEAEPLPYDEDEVEFANGDITLAGTLTLPRTAGPHPAVVMITGSGPQNRDEQLFGDYRPFRVIADHLTRRDIAVLRYDDRGVGGSSGDVASATSADFAGDVLAAVALLKARADIAAGAIGVIGHSEGGIVGPLAAAQSSDVAFVVMLAGPGLTGEEILFAQGELILRTGGADSAALAAQRAMQAQTFQAIRSDSGWDGVRAAIAGQIRESIAEMPAAQRDSIADVDAMVIQRVEAQITQVRSNWFRFFLDYDPIPALERVRVPILALFGELDLQVPAEPNRDAIEAALRRSGHEDYTLRILPGTNHLFLPTTTGAPSEYATMDKTFVPGFLALIGEWILARTREAAR